VILKRVNQHLALFAALMRSVHATIGVAATLNSAYSGDFDRLFRPNVTEDSAGSAL
jgi:hypothetical protein